MLYSLLYKVHFVATFASIGLFRLILCGYVNSLATVEKKTSEWQQQQLLNVSAFLCTPVVLISIILLVSWLATLVAWV